MSCWNCDRNLIRARHFVPLDKEVNDLLQILTSFCHESGQSSLVLSLKFGDVLFEFDKASSNSQQYILILYNQSVLLTANQVELIPHVNDRDT